MDVSPDTCRRRRVGPLVLLYFFVMKAAADCPKPQGTGNIVLTNEALLLNDFPEASHVTVECANGYVNESGSGITTCANGVWSKPDLVCKRKDCGVPRPQPHMSFNLSAGTLFGAEIKVACDKGYQVSGSSYKFCYASGWVGRTKCEVVTCERPAEVSNGKNSWDSQDYPKYGAIVHYVCNEGYVLHGKNNLTCEESGEYDSLPPSCIVVPKPPIISISVAAPTATPPPPALHTSTASSAPPTAGGDKPATTGAMATVSASARAGVRGVLSGGHEATASATSTTSFQGGRDGVVDANKDTGYVPIIVSVICVSIALCVVVLFLSRFFLKRKGSYDTREDLKPELLQFQNL